MTPEELITGAQLLDDGAVTFAKDHEDDLILAALETYFGHGVADDEAGMVHGPFGHVYRVDRWIVQTDNYGNREVIDGKTELNARRFFAELTEDEDA